MAGTTFQSVEPVVEASREMPIMSLRSVIRTLIVPAGTFWCNDPKMEMVRQGGS